MNYKLSLPAGELVLDCISSVRDWFACSEDCFAKFTPNIEFPGTTGLEFLLTGMFLRLPLSG